MNPLFRKFYEALRKAAEDELRATELRKVINSGRKAGAFKDIGNVRRGVRSITTAMRGGQIAKYGRVSDLIKRTIWNEMLRAMGPIGSVIGAMIRPRARAIVEDIDRELQAAQQLLEEFGYQVTAPRQRQGGAKPLETTPGGFTPAKPMPPTPLATPGEPVRQSPRKPEEIEEGRRAGTSPDGSDATLIIKRIAGRRYKIRRTDPLLTGQMIKVRSSNVHSIGYLWNDEDPAHGTLQVRFLDHRKGREGRAGSGYQYFQVHPEVFIAFTKAASKGKFVWDRLRVRGTVSGHQYRYAIATLSSDEYVPRKARIKGINGKSQYHIGPPNLHGSHDEYFLRRSVKGADGTVHQSRLPEERVNRGLPNRGRPNRGEPNRGR